MNRSEAIKLIEHVESEATTNMDGPHGPGHWRCVSNLGITLAVAEAVDPMIPFLFGLFHDSKRKNDGDDPRHGYRASSAMMNYFDPFVTGERNAGVPYEVWRRALNACLIHTSVDTVDNAKEGVCLDADRINLGRVGIVCDPQYLSTRTGKEQYRLWVDQWAMPPRWDDILDRLAFLGCIERG